MREQAQRQPTETIIDLRDVPPADRGPGCRRTEGRPIGQQVAESAHSITDKLTAIEQELGRSRV